MAVPISWKGLPECFSLSHSCTISLGACVGESSPKGNDSELLDKIGGRNVVCISNVHVDWLIAVCHSNLSDTLINHSLVTH